MSQSWRAAAVCGFLAALAAFSPLPMTARLRAADPKSPAPGPEAKGLRIRLRLPEVARGGEAPGHCFVDLENRSEKDLNLKLGFSLANGKSHHPEALRMLLTGPGDERRELIYAGIPGIAGRVDPYIVPLPAGSGYSLRLRFADFADVKTGQRVDFAAKEQSLAVEFEGQAITETNSDDSAVALITVWRGTIRSETTPLRAGE